MRLLSNDVAWGRRAVGLLLVALVVLPVYRLLGHAAAGYAGEVTVHVAELQRELLLAGALLSVLPALIAARLLSPARLATLLGGVRRVLLCPRPGTFAVGAGALCGALTLLFSLLVLELQASHIDSLAQLLHARFWASGMLAGPILANEFWHIQNSLVTERGWVSQYPPGHIAVLAIGMRLGAVWLVGPLLAAVTVTCALLAAERWLPVERAALRLGALMLAVSPFFVAISGSYMNHVTAAAFLAVAALLASHAANGGWGWAVGAGTAAALAFATRPLAALAIGTAVVIGAWASAGARYRLVRNLALACAGALPVLVTLGWYNHWFFGAAHRFGYNVALGPAAGLGFGVDPWGNRYGLREAIGWTGADLQSLSLSWLESPLPLVLIVGAFLLLARRLATGERILVGAVLLHLGANFFYWHHGIFMGPRMLHEAAPWWILLGAVAMVRLVRLAPVALPGRLAGYSPRAALAAFYLTCITTGVLWLAPQRLATYGAGHSFDVPQVDGPALVFVHDAWMGRVAMDLAAAGMRLDEVETLLRQNPTCAVAALADARRADPAGGAALLHRLDRAPRPAPPAPLAAPGSAVRRAPNEPLTAACALEVYADRHGIYDIAPVAWRGDVPGDAPAGPLFVRDLGPERNRVALAAFPGRTAYSYGPDELAGPPVLQPYGAGISARWNGSAGTP